MTDERIAADVTFSLARTRRRERLIKAARGSGDWWYALLYASVGVLCFLMARAGADHYLVGMCVFVGISEFRRLNNRINALTRLLEEEPAPFPSDLDYLGAAR